MKKFSYLLVLIIAFLIQLGSVKSVRAQGIVDTLLQQLNESKSDTTSFRIFVLLSENCLEQEIEGYALTAISMADDLLSKDKALKNNLGFQSNHALAYINLAFYYKKLGDFTSALQNLEKAIGIDEKLKNYGAMITPLNNLGSLYEDLNENDKAFSTYQRALGYKKYSDDGHISAIYKNLGRYYQSKGNYDSALIELKLSVDIRSKLPNKIDYSMSLACLGQLYFALKDYKLAEEFVVKAIDEIKEFGAHSDLSRYTALYGNVLEATGRIDDAEKKYIEAYTIAIGEGFPSEIDSSTSELYIHYKKQGNYIESLKYLEENILIKSKIATDKKNYDNYISLLQKNHYRLMISDSLCKSKGEKTNFLIGNKNFDKKESKIYLIILIVMLALLTIYLAVRLKKTKTTKLTSYTFKS